MNLNDSINNGSANSNAKTIPAVVEQDFEITDCIKFVQCMRKALSMFEIENKFISKLIGSMDHDMSCKILERIFDQVLRSLNHDAEVN